MPSHPPHLLLLVREELFELAPAATGAISRRTEVCQALPTNTTADKSRRSNTRSASMFQVHVVAKGTVTCNHLNQDADYFLILCINIVNLYYFWLPNFCLPLTRHDVRLRN